MTDAFYEPAGDGRYISTRWTTGPWDPGSQHAGPPSALTARSIELLEPGWRVARFTFEILRAVPVAPLTLEARVARPGRRVQFCEATMRTDDGTEIARAEAWRIRGDATEPTAAEPPPFAGPEESPELETLGVTEPHYMTAMEWRFAKGSFVEPGPATVWMRMRLPLVPGEEPTGVQRVLCAADSGNGVSREVDFATHLFINTELSVHLFADPEGEWVALDARTRMGPDGLGLATTEIYDEQRRVGAGNQALLIAPR